MVSGVKINKFPVLLKFFYNVSLSKKCFLHIFLQLYGFATMSKWQQSLAPFLGLWADGGGGEE